MLYGILDLIFFIMKGLIALMLCITVWSHLLMELESYIKEVRNSIKTTIENHK